MSKALAVRIESMAPRKMGSFLRMTETGLNLRIRSGHIAGSDKLAMSPLMHLNQVTMFARRKQI